MLSLRFRNFVRTKFTLPDLPYDYNALEPIISADIMKVHHQKHHQAYVDNLNKFSEQLDSALAKKDVSQEISLQSQIQFNGGGHINHSIFWTNLQPVKDYQDPQGKIMDAIKSEFGNLESFKIKFNQKAASVQGSGWAWLGLNDKKRLEIQTTANQDPLVLKGLVPLLGIDVWEHAYYLQYKNARPDYLNAIWKVVNWKNVAERFDSAMK